MTEPGMQKLLKQAREMREKHNRRLAATVVEARRAGGKIAGKMDGHRKLLSFHINPEFLRDERLERVEEEIMGVVNALADKIDEALEKRFGIVDKMPSLDGLFGDPL